MELGQVMSLFKNEPNKASEKIEHWLAIDIYPEYKEDAQKVMDFIRQIYFDPLNNTQH